MPKIDVEALMKQAGFIRYESTPISAALNNFTKLIVEECAVVCEQQALDDGHDYQTGKKQHLSGREMRATCAAAIRALKP